MSFERREAVVFTNHSTKQYVTVGMTEPSSVSWQEQYKNTKDIKAAFIPYVSNGTEWLHRYGIGFSPQWHP